MPRLSDLTPDEVADLFQCAHRIVPILEKVHSSTALTLAVQDGRDAGQTVEHVHVHLIPRKKGDFDKNDDVYERVSSKYRQDYNIRSYQRCHHIKGRCFQSDASTQRKDRIRVYPSVPVRCDKR